MAATVAKIGKGTQLLRGDGGGSELFTAISELHSVSGPGISMDAPEATNMDSPSGYKEFVAGLRDLGELTLECAFLNDATQNMTAGILKDLHDGTKRNFKVSWPTSTVLTPTFAAYVVGWAPKSSKGDVMMVEVKLRATGPATWA